jgi:hypothetical protein
LKVELEKLRKFPTKDELADLKLERLYYWNIIIPYQLVTSITPSNIIWAEILGFFFLNSKGVRKYGAPQKFRARSFSHFAPHQNRHFLLL